MWNDLLATSFPAPPPFRFHSLFVEPRACGLAPWMNGSGGDIMDERRRMTLRQIPGMSTLVPSRLEFERGEHMT